MTTFAETIVTARRRRKGEKSASLIRFEGPGGKLVTCPRGWRTSATPGQLFRIRAHMRADGACYVADPSTPPEPITHG